MTFRVRKLPYVADIPDSLVETLVWDCKSCGARDVGYRKMEQIERGVVKRVLGRRRPLLPPEIRLLRNHLGLGNQQFANAMGVDRVTVSRWESKKTAARMSSTAERLLRLMVQFHILTGELPKFSEASERRAS